MNDPSDDAQTEWKNANNALTIAKASNDAKQIETAEARVAEAKRRLPTPMDEQRGPHWKGT